MLQAYRFAVITAFLASLGLGTVTASPLVHPRPPRSPGPGIGAYRHTPPRRPGGSAYINPFLRSGHGKPGTWQPVLAAPPFGSNGSGTPLLLTDGTVMVHDNAANWYRLIPDAFGSYVNGTWSKAIPLPAGYGPLYYASAVLPDGRLEIEGGEYNFFNLVETNLGAIYDPRKNAWSSVSPPPGWSSIGDAQSAVLSDGTLMIGDCCDAMQALFDEAKRTWTQTGKGKADDNSEEGWTLLPDGTVLTVDVSRAGQSERYDPSTGSWASAGSLPVNVVAYGEIGPQVLRPDGTVFVAGATGHTAIYSSRLAKWAKGPDFPVVGGQQLDVADGPGTLLPDGHVLVVASPGAYHPPATFFEFDGKHLLTVAAPPDAPSDSSFNVRLLMLPSGEVLETNGNNDVEVYTPRGKPLAGIAPTIVSVPATLQHGKRYTLRGRLLNGVSQANMYGDDAQMATNYPLVRIVNVASGHVFYARTHDFTSMAVASRKISKTKFDVPAGIEGGASSLTVVTNGIASMPVAVMVQ